MRPVLFLFALAFVAGASFAMTSANSRAAAAALEAAGYQLVGPPKLSVFGACMRGRQAFDFRAWRDGEPVRGKVCAGGIFVRPSITEGGWR